MIGFPVSALQLSEIFISCVLHLFYGLYIFSIAVVGDLSQSLNELFYKPNLLDAVIVEEERLTGTDDLPPIVLVHGIFGFGKGVMCLSELFFFFIWVHLTIFYYG